MMLGETAVPRRPARVSEALRVRQRDVARPGAHSRRADAREPGGVEPGVGRGARPPGVHDDRCDRTRAAGSRRLTLTMADPLERGLVWPQRLHVALGYRTTRSAQLPVDVTRSRHARCAAAVGLERPLYVLPNGDGLGYGLFVLDAASRTYLLAHVEEIPDALTRGSAWVTLWDNLLEAPRAARRVRRRGAARAAARDGRAERPARPVAMSSRAFWRYLPDAERDAAPAGARDGAARRHRSRGDAEPEGGLVQRLSRHGADARRRRLARAGLAPRGEDSRA